MWIWTNLGQGRVLVCTLHPDRQKHDGEVKSDDPFVKAIPTDKRLPVMLLQVNTVTCVCLVAEFVTFYHGIFITEKKDAIWKEYVLCFFSNHLKSIRKSFGNQYVLCVFLFPTTFFSLSGSVHGPSLPKTKVTKKILKIPGKLDPFQLWPMQIVTWNEFSKQPLAKLQGQCLGRAGSLEAEEKHALLANELADHDVDFPEEELDEVDEIVKEAWWWLFLGISDHQDEFFFGYQVDVWSLCPFLW